MVQVLSIADVATIPADADDDIPIISLQDVQDIPPSSVLSVVENDDVTPSDSPSVISLSDIGALVSRGVQTTVDVEQGVSLEGLSRRQRELVERRREAFPTGVPALEGEAPRSLREQEQEIIDQEQRGLEGRRIFDIPRRFVSAITTTATEALRLDDPLGLDPETIVEAQKFGLLSSPEDRFGFNPFNTPQDVLDASIIGTIALGDAGLRAFEAVYNSVFAGIGQIGREVGLSNEDANSLEGNVKSLIDFAILQTGVANPEAFLIHRPPSVERAIRQEARNIANRASGSLSPAARSRLADDLEQLTIRATDDAIDAAIDIQINAPTMSDVSNAATRLQVGTDTERAIIAFRQGGIDGFDFMRFVTEQGRKEGIIPPDLDAYLDLRLLRGGFRGTVEEMQMTGTPIWTEAGDLGFSGEGFNAVFANVPGREMPNDMRYFAARRARNLEDRGIQSGFTEEMIERGLSHGERVPEIADSFVRYQALDDRILEFAVQSGRISAEQRVLFRTAAGADEAGVGGSYVPWWRHLDDDKRSALAGGRALMRIEGSDRPLAGIMENMSRNAVMWVTESMRNSAKLNTYDTLERMGYLGEGGVATRVLDIPRAVRIVDEDVAALLAESGFATGSNESAVIVQAMTGTRLRGQTGPNGGQLDIFYRNGERMVYEINDPLFLQSMQHMNPTDLGWFVNWVGGPIANLKRVTITSLPGFAAFNMSRDTFQAAVFSQAARPFIPIWTTVTKGMWSVLVKDKDYRLSRLNGGGFGGFYDNETANLTRLQDYYRSFGITAERQVLVGTERLARNVTDSLRAGWRWYEDTLAVTERSSRRAEGNLMIEGGANRRVAALAERDVSTDFALRGQNRFVQQYMAITPFLNARLQGLDRIARRVAEDPMRTLSRGFITQTLPTLALYQANRDNPDYWAIPDWRRDANWVIPLEGGNLYYPKAFETSAIFATSIERGMEMIEQENGRTFVDFLIRTLDDTMSLDFPAFAAPIVGIATNRTFTGAPIVSRALEGVRASQQFGPQTSQGVVDVAAAMREEVGIEISPVQVEYLINQYLGTFGNYMLAAADVMTSDAENPTIRISEIELVGRFYREFPMMSTQHQMDFYDLYSSAREQVLTESMMNRIMREPEFTEREEQLLLLFPILDDIHRDISSMRQMQNDIRRSETLVGEEKREQIDGLQREINRVFISIMTDLGRDDSDYPEVRNLLREHGIRTSTGPREVE